jgi:vacuolar-type H+-ATPase subunit E/Vma4
MNDDEVQKQLDQMVKFIYREADEKAGEILEKAREECAIEKGKIVMEEKLKIMKDFERKEKIIETKIKMWVITTCAQLTLHSAYSNELNQSRLAILKARDEGIQKLLGEAHQRLSSVSKDTANYKKLLRDLIIQVRIFYLARFLNDLIGFNQTPRTKGFCCLQKTRCWISEVSAQWSCF